MTDQDFNTITPSTPICVVTIAEYRDLLKSSLRYYDEHTRRLEAEQSICIVQEMCDRLKERVAELEAMLPRPYTGDVSGDTIRGPIGKHGPTGPHGLRGSDLIESEKARNPHD